MSKQKDPVDAKIPETGNTSEKRTPEHLNPGKDAAHTPHGPSANEVREGFAKTPNVVDPANVPHAQSASHDFSKDVQDPGRMASQPEAKPANVEGVDLDPTNPGLQGLQQNPKGNRGPTGTGKRYRVTFNPPTPIGDGARSREVEAVDEAEALEKWRQATGFTGQLAVDPVITEIIS